MRLLAIFLVLALLFAVPFLLWGDRFETVFSHEGAVKWLEEYGDWAWVAALVLFILDLVLPVPSTAVMAALGLVYGAVLGGLIGAAGSVLSGCTAYALCRWLGRSAAIRIAGEKDLERGERLFATAGGWVVALSRWLPLFPEVIACMAGLSRMPFLPFLIALICGTLPMAMTFAVVGSLGVEWPRLAIVLSAGLPVLLWPIAQWALARERKSRA